MGFPDYRKYCTILLKVGDVLAAEYRGYTIEVDSNNILAMIGRAAYYCALAFHRAFKLGGNVLPPGCRAARDLDGLSFTRSFETCPTQSKSSNSMYDDTPCARAHPALRPRSTYSPVTRYSCFYQPVVQYNPPQSVT